MNTLINIYVVYRIVERDKDGNPEYVSEVEHFDIKEDALKIFNERRYSNGSFVNDNVKMCSLQQFIDKFHLTGEVKNNGSLSAYEEK